jgi:hypothetical protein
MKNRVDNKKSKSSGTALPMLRKGEEEIYLSSTRQISTTVTASATAAQILKLWWFNVITTLIITSLTVKNVSVTLRPLMHCISFS